MHQKHRLHGLKNGNATRSPSLNGLRSESVATPFTQRVNYASELVTSQLADGRHRNIAVTAPAVKIRTTDHRVSVLDQQPSRLNLWRR